MTPHPATRFLSSLCSLDAEELAGQFCDDARVSAAGGLLAAGKPAICRTLKRAISSLAALDCEPAVVWNRNAVSVVEADLMCERFDGARAAFPVTLILRFRNELIADARLFAYQPALIGNFLQLSY